MISFQTYRNETKSSCIKTTGDSESSGSRTAASTVAGGAESTASDRASEGNDRR